MSLATLLRSMLLLAGLSVLVACGRNDLDEPPVALGDFKLGLNIVVADNMQKVPISRDATVDEWETGIKKAVQDRFGRYQGNRFYNIGIAVDGYALAPPGIPVVAAPKSVVVVTANIWDDSTQTRLNGEPKQFTIFENVDPNMVIGSGLTKTKRQQLDALSYNVAKALEKWFLENPNWFANPPVPDLRPDGSKAMPDTAETLARQRTERAAAAPAAADMAAQASVGAVTTAPLPEAGTSTGSSAGTTAVRPPARPADLATGN
ncbi:hypothetical protein L0V05_04200 [Tabrizicola sp. J26]|uniref:hypothetical protein n=1 Tax=Alitabrizicola rongguiensis TaxID=2909234 RepID=UPI001F41ABFC|nr:hypothetical protein [Tabrizicola rongguiensis]MCF1708015.1 hypothetical protein [Tabrizicola rongguiensis]